MLEETASQASGTFVRIMRLSAHCLGCSVLGAVAQSLAVGFASYLLYIVAGVFLLPLYCLSCFHGIMVVDYLGYVICFSLLSFYVGRKLPSYAFVRGGLAFLLMVVYDAVANREYGQFVFFDWNKDHLEMILVLAACGTFVTALFSSLGARCQDRWLEWVREELREFRECIGLAADKDECVILSEIRQVSRHAPDHHGEEGSGK